MQNGFTLIELLVVVLIVGILSAVAIPYFGKVVEQSRAVEGFTLGAKLDEAMSLYLLTNGFPNTDGTIPMKELLASSSLGYELTMEEDRICTKDFMAFFSCTKNEYHSGCEISVKRMDGLNKKRACLQGGYPLYIIFFRSNTAQSLNFRYCDAYENYARRYYPGKEGVPTRICEFLKNNGQVDEVRLHDTL